MTVRRAELLMALLLGAFSIYLMIKSTELPVGWIKGSGPGGGAWPFWLSAGMLLCCVWTLVRWFRRVTPESRNEEPFMERLTVKIFAMTAGSLLLMIAATHFIGVYFSIMLFLIYYMRFVGRHSWLTTGALVVGIPIGIFFFFEVGLKILLPKGYTEPLFYPIYKIVF